MVTVILAEKENQAAAYAESLGSASKKVKYTLLNKPLIFQMKFTLLLLKGIYLNTDYQKIIGI